MQYISKIIQLDQLPNQILSSFDSQSAKATPNPASASPPNNSPERESPLAALSVFCAFAAELDELLAEAFASVTVGCPPWCAVVVFIVVFVPAAAAELLDPPIPMPGAGAIYVDIHTMEPIVSLPSG